MRYSRGVVTFGWPQAIMLEVERACDRATQRVLRRDARITSGREGDHSHPQSWHYFPPVLPNGGILIAFDLRTWPKMTIPGQILPATREAYRFELQGELDALAPECGVWRVVKETTHLHNQGRIPLMD